MGLLKHLKSRSRSRRASPQVVAGCAASCALPCRRYLERLPANVLENILTFVCPHVLDRSYEASENSQLADGCMLCDLRDLASCARVCRRWCKIAQTLLYTCVRIDAVHYCALEEVLVEKRRRKASSRPFRGRASSARSADVPTTRLQLLCRTVREQPRLAGQLVVLKLPYMTRETAKADLARTVGALPGLEYVDLPDAFYSGESSCITLRQELQARCPSIRKTIYRAGSEASFRLLMHGLWNQLEILELSALSVEPALLRIILSSLTSLRNLSLSHSPWLDDCFFAASQSDPPASLPLESLKLVNLPNVTAEGIKHHLERNANRHRLRSLGIEDTGILISELAHILPRASSLQDLSFSATVSSSLTASASSIQPLSSASLRTLHFQIISPEGMHGLQSPAESYYAYLASSLHQNALPLLKTLYVRDERFPELLLVSSAIPRFSPAPRIPGKSPRGSASFEQTHGSTAYSASVSSPSLSLPVSSGFNHTLEVFSKGIDEHEWVFTAISASSSNHASRSHGGRPLSAYSASRGLGPQWAPGGPNSEARRSVIVGNGFGGFLAIPQEAAPKSTGNGSNASFGNTRLGMLAAFRSQENLGNPLKSPLSLGEGGRRHSKHDLWR